MKAHGINVPNSFGQLGQLIKDTSKANNCYKQSEDYRWITPQLYNPTRKMAHFFCSISRETAAELTYNRMKVSQILSDEGSIGRTLGLLWLKCELPVWLCK